MDIYLIRHGETDYNVNGIIQGGGVDSSINQKGQKQANAFYSYYQDVSFDFVFTSGLKRTQQTVKPFLELGIPTQAWREIDEMNWGIHEGQPFAEWMREGYTNMIAEWDKGNLDAKLEEGESAYELISRLSIFVNHLKALDHNTILVCSHGRAMRGLMSVIKEEHPREMEKYRHSNTGLYKMKMVEQRFIVELENDTRHLEGLL
ncbi:MAG: histidine phosphatase family protein [Bacteroidota bacterium]